MRIKITQRGIFVTGSGVEPEELEVGSEHTIKGDTLPASFVSKAVAIGGEKSPAAIPVLNVTPKLEAKHRGKGSWSVMRGEDEVSSGLSKDDAEAFNAMSHTDQAEYVGVR